MPLIHISLLEGKSTEYIKKVADTVHESLRHAWGIPEHDRFQLIQEYKKTHFFIDPIMWDIDRSDDVIVIYITSIPRDESMKQALYKDLMERLGKAVSLRPQDIFISIVHNQKCDWSFGNGVAQLLQLTQ